MTSESIETLSERYGSSYRWILTTTGMMAAMCMILTSTMVNVAVPSIMGAYGVGQDEAQWMATAFLATMTASQLLGAWVIATFGARNGYLGAVLIFMFGTILGAVAPNIDILIFARVVQGFAAGVVQPIAMITIFRVFPPEKRGLALSVYGMGIMVAPILGPVVGGIAIDTWSWRHLFFVPLPVAALALVLGAFFMPGRDPDARKTPFDWVGYTLVVGAIVSLMIYIAYGQRDGWTSDASLIRAALTLTFASGFIISQLRSAAPILDCSLFKNPQFVAAAVLGFVFGAGNFGSTYLIPVFVQSVQNFSPTASGLVTVPAGVVLMVLFPIAGRLVDTIAVRYLAMFGLAVFAVGAMLLQSTDVNTAYWTLAFYVVVGRLGMSIMMPTITISALRALTPEQLNQGSGAINFVRLMGGACGVNGLVAFMERRTEFHSLSLTATQTPDNSSSQELLSRVADMLGAVGVPEAIVQPGALHFLGRVVEAQAQTMGFKDGFMILTVVFVLALFPAWTLGRKKKEK
ncbi:MAG: DHA2 family efflux MFS transporter permease subunit [Alphaproteobacteria bacterium]|nr:DHA2 family efflux MFS transporter permease subunit [Alphaproteobacteria bacterium]